MTDITQKIKAANGRLKINNYKITIEQRGGNLFLRAILPPNPNSGSNKHFQQRIKIASANDQGVKIAEKEAKKLRMKLDDNIFDWGEYLDEIEQPKIITIGDYVKQFEKDYFERRGKTFKTEHTFRIEYEIVFKKLPLNREPSPEIFKQTILSTEANTRTRKRFCQTLNIFAKFTGINFDTKPYIGNYSNKSRVPRNIPSDKLIGEWYYKIENLKWRWIYGMLATYGLRNHEVFFINLDSLRRGEKVIEVLAGKTGYRKIWPLHPEWFDEFGLQYPKIPDVNLNRTNSQIGGSVSQHFRRNEGLPFKVYDLRHAWAVRSLEYGIDISLAAQQMGHSLQVHSNLYHTWITDKSHQRAFELAINKADRPKPPKFN
jgi:integrase